MGIRPSIQRIAIVGNYLPRRCGIATFSSDLRKALTTQYEQAEAFVIPVNDIEGGYSYPEEVRFEIEEQDAASYQRAADFLNLNNVDVVSLQHEFGIFGGPAGSLILNLIRNLRMPVVTTLHTVLSKPNADQRRVMRGLVQMSSRLTVMSEKAMEFMRGVYGAPAEKLDLIAHGIPDMPFVDPNFYKDQFGVEGRNVLLTFGLLSPNKGVENVFKALPAILAEFPNTVYIVLGATHPALLREQGETYRLDLERLARDLQIERHVIFYNRFVELSELKEFLGVTDIYITPYLNAEQITSGTLAYSFGCGKAVVSTPYWHAQELLADGRGILVPFHDSDAIARETIGLMRDEVRRHAMRKAAYRLGRDMVWDYVAHLYYQSFEKARMSSAARPRAAFASRTLDRAAEELPRIKLDHLEQLTDSTGVLQHANFNVPNYAEGYCTDDNARALLLMVLLEELGIEGGAARRIEAASLAFLNFAFNPANSRFRNFLGFHRVWLEEQGSEDCHGRALWALGACVGRSQRPGFRTLAGQIFLKALEPIREFTSPRAWAFSLVGIHEYFRSLSGDRHVNQMREHLTERLSSLFERTSESDWPWFEEVVSYDNAKLAHALLLSGYWGNNGRAREIGMHTLEWLFAKQSTERGRFRPIGSNGFFRRGSERARFDQQPIEAHSMVSACIEAFRQTGEAVWRRRAEIAFDWFLGHNDLGLPLYDARSGGCRDALHMDRVNENQGAESTLSFLLALAEMQLLRNETSSFNLPAAAPTPLPST
ncbi:MAG: glycosyltransferase family 4 protein [Verrucomicrobiae bacterium]|nr:glycosyltransferase family 4 protein [Verrucomicrobiae bacterium]